MPSMDYINKKGLQAAIDQLRALCMTKADGEAIYKVLSTLADAVVFPAVSISIPAAGWQSSAAGDFAVYIDVAAPDVTAADGVDVALSAGSIAAARTCGLCPTVETLGGYLRFRAVSAPKTEMTGEYRIIRGASQTEEVNS